MSCVLNMAALVFISAHPHPPKNSFLDLDSLSEFTYQKAQNKIYRAYSLEVIHP